MPADPNDPLDILNETEPDPPPPPPKPQVQQVPPGAQIMLRPRMTRQEFELEANLRLIQTFSSKDGIAHVHACQNMAQALTDALHRRGLFGDPRKVLDATNKMGITRYKAPTPRSRTQEQPVVDVRDESGSDGGNSQGFNFG